MSGITTHVLDTARGEPARGVPVSLEMMVTGGEWKLVGRGKTNADGRLKELLPEGSDLIKGTYRLIFDTAAYFRKQKSEAFFPEVQVLFEVRDPSRHHHVPLLLSSFGYSTYRGS